MNNNVGEVGEVYVSLETAKLLKEKGFDSPCMGRYSVRSKEFHLDCTKMCNNGGLFECSAPTLDAALRWLRKVKHYYVQVMLDSWALGAHSGYYIVIQATDSDFEEVSPCDPVFFNEPEEAGETGLKYCLENLI